MATLQRLNEIIEGFAAKKDKVISDQSQTIATQADEIVSLKNQLADALANDKADAEAISAANAEKDQAVKDREQVRQQLESQSAEIETDNQQLKELTSVLKLDDASSDGEDSAIAG